MDDELLQTLIAAMEQKCPVALATVVATAPGSEAFLGRKLLVCEDGATLGGLGDPRWDLGVREVGMESLHIARSRRWVPAGTSTGGGPQVDVYIDPILPRPTLLVVGAGHIGVPLAKLGKMLGFEVVVVDDRASFASRERFPEADDLIVDDIAAALGRIPITPSTFLVLVTRGHRHDERALRQVVGSSAAYIGMIGSRRRVKTVLGRLEAEGVSPELLRRVHAPIGLDLGAETPEEIALSILAELVMVNRGGKGGQLSSQRRKVEGSQ